jgi:hypothetical protein
MYVGGGGGMDGGLGMRGMQEGRLFISRVGDEQQQYSPHLLSLGIRRRVKLDCSTGAVEKEALVGAAGVAWADTCYYQVGDFLETH